jgi:bilirubin oxidase
MSIEKTRSSTLLTILIVVTTLAACSGFSEKKHTPINPLAIPVLLDSRASQHLIDVDIQQGKHEFFPGKKSSTMGFNGNYLGPTIRLYKGEKTRLRFHNKLAEPTTVHGHGLHISGKIDGGPQNVIPPQATWDITMPIIQQASTSWYHPHFMGKTAEHVHAGLAGLYIIEDENSLALDLPKDYGVNDIPIVIQDRNFVDGKMATYKVSMQDIMEGLREDTIIINGTIAPFVKVPKGLVRLRLLNGSNSRAYSFYLSNNQPFYKVATDGGFLEAPVQISELKMASGERNEIIVDMSTGQNIELKVKMLDVENNWLSTMFAEKRSVLALQVDENLPVKGTLPTKLNTIDFYEKNQAQAVREFRLQMDMGGEGGEGDEDMNENMSMPENVHTGAHKMGDLFSINGAYMTMDVINERVKLGDTELWRIRADGMEHPFHVHGTSFQIISQNGEAPSADNRGWKDVVVVGEGWTEVMMRFNLPASEEYPFMYHCHILEHEDGGMMGQFTVQ